MGVLCQLAFSHHKLYIMCEEGVSPKNVISSLSKENVEMILVSIMFILDIILTWQKDLDLGEACVAGSLPRVYQVGGRQAARRFLLLILATF